MSLGGSFILKINNGYADETMNMTKLLSSRIENYYQAIYNTNPAKYEKITKPYLDYESIIKNLSNIPSELIAPIEYIEKSHITFINTGFKPYIPLGNSYFKSSSIKAEFGTSSTVVIPHVGNFLSDIVFHVKLIGLEALDNRDRVRYVKLLGHKLFTKITFDVGGIAFDEITPDDYNDYYSWEIGEDRKKAWHRCMGQEESIKGFLTSDPLVDSDREVRYINNGPQTLKQKHDEIDLFIPLLFWFNEPGMALPIHVLRHGDTNIKFTVANINELVGFSDYGGGGQYKIPTIKLDMYSNFLFVPESVMKLYISKLDWVLMRTHRRQKKLINIDCSAGTQELLNNISFPIEHMYISIRPQSNLKLSQYWNNTTKLTKHSKKVPVVVKNRDTIINGNIVSITQNSIQLDAPGLSVVYDAYKNYDILLTNPNGLQAKYIISSYDGTTKTATILGTITNFMTMANSIFELYNSELGINIITYYDETPIIDEMALFSHGERLYVEAPGNFYSSYLPYRYSKCGINPTDTLGKYLITFNMYPLDKNPSGSYNSSLGRELYIYFKSKHISQEEPAELILNARVINFMLIKEGGITFKYIT